MASCPPARDAGRDAAAPRPARGPPLVRPRPASPACHSLIGHSILPRMKILLVACGGVWLHDIARALQKRDALAGLWVSTKNRTGIPADKFRRAWIFHLAVKPAYHLASASAIEKVYHGFFPLW